MPVSRGARAIALGPGRFIEVAMSMILIATGLVAQTSSSSGSSVWQSNSPAPPPTSSNAGAGTLYKDAHGAFSIMIPQGWTARPNFGCYGPNPNNCPENAAGVNIQSPGRTWAFLAPFSGNARQPTDVVKNVAAHLSTSTRISKCCRMIRTG